MSLSREEKLARKKQAAALPWVSWAAMRRWHSTHLGTAAVLVPAALTGRCSAFSGALQRPVPGRSWKEMITSGLLAGAGGEIWKTILTHLPQRGQFSKSKLT